jgi:ABC-type nitrate/sulfonate/bicarbonate transport system substrate-binding protein
MTLDTLWYTRCPVPTAFSLATRLGWLDEEFARDGIRLRSLATSTDPKVRQSHFEHTLPNSLRHGGGIPPLYARRQGSDLRIVGFSLGRSAQRVLALPGSGIRTVKDLAGKRLAVQRRVNDAIDFWAATTLRGYDLILKQAGLSARDVELIDLKVARRFVDDTTASTGEADTLFDARHMLGSQRDAAAALLRGEVDAIFSQGANSVTLQAFLGAVVVGEVAHEGPPSDWVNNGPYPLTLSGPLIDKYPDVASRLIARVREAGVWARDHEIETKRIIAAETGLPEELVDRAFGPKVHEQLELDLSPELVSAYRTLHDDLLARGFISGPVDLEAFIDEAAFDASFDPAQQPGRRLAAV